MEGVPQWEERSHRALHACLSEQPPPGKLLQTELHPRDAEVAGGGCREPIGAEGVVGTEPRATWKRLSAAVLRLWKAR